MVHPLLCPSQKVRYGTVAHSDCRSPIAVPKPDGEIWEEEPSMGDRSTVCAVTCI